MDLALTEAIADAAALGFELELFLEECQARRAAAEAAAARKDDGEPTENIGTVIFNFGGDISRDFRLLWLTRIGNLDFPQGGRFPGDALPRIP